MKVTEQMINAACKADPKLQREQVRRIVQSALDADSFLSRMEYIDVDRQPSISNRYLSANV